MAYPSKVNPITSAGQYGLMQAIAHGGVLRQDFEITPEVAREMIEKTPRRLRSKFATELASMRTKNYSKFRKFSRPDVSERMIHSGKKNWYIYNKKTGEVIGGPYETKNQAQDEAFDLTKGSFVIEQKRQSNPYYVVSSPNDRHPQLMHSDSGDKREIAESVAQNYHRHGHGPIQIWIVGEFNTAQELVRSIPKKRTAKPKPDITITNDDLYDYKQVYFSEEGPEYDAAMKKVIDKILRSSNPGDRSAEELSEEWHGREPKEVLDYDEVEKYEADGAILAQLEELGVLSEDGEEIISLEFDEDPPMLVANVSTDTLEVVGGDQHLDMDSDKSEVVVGHVYLIAYNTDKHHLEGSTGKPESYEHYFGEEYYKGRGYKVSNYEDSDDFFEDLLDDGIVEDAIKDGYLPTLVYDTVNSKIRLIGGRYTIEDVGLRD
jgi:hypothetical protein